MIQKKSFKVLYSSEDYTWMLNLLQKSLDVQNTLEDNEKKIKVIMEKKLICNLTNEENCAQY